VIERKNEELQIEEDYRRKLVTIALVKWMDVCAKHADRLKLMQSFRDIKKEGESGRAFYERGHLVSSPPYSLFVFPLPNLISFPCS